MQIMAWLASHSLKTFNDVNKPNISLIMTLKCEFNQA